jgi:hypothetical protein
MKNNNFDEYVSIAEKQILNKENNPTVSLVLSRLSDGLKYYKSRYEECQKVIAKKNTENARLIHLLKSHGIEIGGDSL